MIKAAAWRLAHLLRVRPSVVLAAADLKSLIEQGITQQTKSGEAGEASRLAAKIARLKSNRAGESSK